MSAARRPIPHHMTSPNASPVVVITGASAGIGAATTHLLASRGHRVIAVARRKDVLETVARPHGTAVYAIAADMTERSEVFRVIARGLTAFGHIDVWINNVGQGITRPPSQLTDDDIDDVMRVNVKSALYGMQAILPHFKERGTGHVINVSSMLGRIPLATFRSAYCGAKHFLNALTATFRGEVQETHPGIEFFLVSPGVVRTEFGGNALHGGPDSRALPFSQSAEEVAEVIARTIETRASDVDTRPFSAQHGADYSSKLGIDG